MEKLYIFTTNSITLPHVHSFFSFFHPVIFSVSHDESQSFTMCSVSISSCHFKDSLSYLLSFLHPKVLFLFPGSFLLGKKASKPIFSYLSVLKSPLDSTIHNLFLLSFHFSRSFSGKLLEKFVYIHCSTLSPPIHSWACFFWFIPDGYKNLFLSRPLSTFKLPNLGVHLPVSILLKLQETFHPVSTPNFSKYISPYPQTLVFQADFSASYQSPW